MPLPAASGPKLKALMPRRRKLRADSTHTGGLWGWKKSTAARIIMWTLFEESALFRTNFLHYPHIRVKAWNKSTLRYRQNATWPHESGGTISPPSPTSWPHEISKIMETAWSRHCLSRRLPAPVQLPSGPLPFEPPNVGCSVCFKNCHPIIVILHVKTRALRFDPRLKVTIADLPLSRLSVILRQHSHFRYNSNLGSKCATFRVFEKFECEGVCGMCGMCFRLNMWKATLWPDGILVCKVVQEKLAVTENWRCTVAESVCIHCSHLRHMPAARRDISTVCDITIMHKQIWFFVGPISSMFFVF